MRIGIPRSSQATNSSDEYLPEVLMSCMLNAVSDSRSDHLERSPEGAVAPSPAEGAARSVTAGVVQRLEDLLFGDLQPGSELPSESELAGQLGVSRLTVREAT